MINIFLIKKCYEIQYYVIGINEHNISFVRNKYTYIILKRLYKDK